MPLLVFTGGAILIAAQLRKSSVEMDALRDECLRLRELNASLMELRQTADSARTSVEGIRSRGVRRAVDR
jgi:hypothetical protein